MYLFDSDVLIWALRGRKDIVDKISELKEESPTSLSVMSIAEIFQNIFPSELTTTEDFLHQHLVYDIDEKIAKMAGLYWQEFHKQLKTLSITDCLIAATANVHNLTLVSLNTKHFPMKDIQTLNSVK